MGISHKAGAYQEASHKARMYQGASPKARTYQGALQNLQTFSLNPFSHKIHIVVCMENQIWAMQTCLKDIRIEM
jgi:hypothetical protein